ncbi:MAG: hypothetical protein HQ477_10435 [Chloroflexi bacterium]|nr:hypothetical protein [Chloroflexota bacterium]
MALTIKEFRPSDLEVILDIEENDNYGNFPVQVFETQSEPRSFSVITIRISPKMTNRTPSSVGAQKQAVLVPMPPLS